MGLIELKISEQISASTVVTDETDAIGNGVRFEIIMFEASCPDSPLATSRIQFGDEIIWVVQREGTMPIKKRFTGDGVKTLKLICENGCAEGYYFNGFLRAVTSG